MPQVVLVGDSIRMGYQATVKKELEGTAEIWAPETNGGDSSNVLAHLEEWVISRKPDVLHLNCGLHDLHTDPDTGEKQVPLADYRKNLQKIFSSVRAQSPSTKLIWVTTTPVNYEWHHQNKPFDRMEDDVDEYNAAALEIAQEHGAQVDDLFKVIMDAGKGNYLSPDGVHFNEEGYVLLGRTAAAAIRSAL